MSLVIEIFRSDDYVPDGQISFLPFLRDFFREFIGDDLHGVTFELLFYELSDLTPDRGTPSLVNLRASHGYVRVRILRNGELLYQHPHPVREVVGATLREMLRHRDPDVTHWGFGLNGPGLESIPLARPAPQLAHELKVASRTRRPTMFIVEELPEPELPEDGLAGLGAEMPDDAAQADRAAGPPVRVAIPEALVTSLTRTLPFSSEIEEGGFLIGKVFRDKDREGGYIVHVRAVIPAERTGASMLNFTFTGESFLRINEQLAARDRGEVLLGWYHTHLFPATSRLGLSSVDVDLHRSTFRRAWQLAALVNISADGRVLRFYHGKGDDMAQVPYWMVPS